MPFALIESDHCHANLVSSPIEPSWILDGNPEARSRVLSTSACGTATTLIWSCTGGKFNWYYDVDETIVILEGSIVIESRGMPPKRYGVGDVIFFREGEHAIWHVEGYVKKIAFCRQTNPLGLGLVIRAVNKLKQMGARAATHASPIAALLALVLVLAITAASAQTRPRQHPAPTGEDAVRDRINAWTIGLAGGLLEGAPIRFATEIARVVNDDGEMHVLPVVTRGPTENVNDLLYLKGIDVAIINGDSLDEYRVQVPQIGDRIVQVLNLLPSELHVFVRPEISSLAELAGKKVNFNTQGTAAAYSGPLIFSRLGIEVDKTFLPHPVALEKMRRGEIAAVVFVTSKPVAAFANRKWEEGFKFLPVEYGPKLSDYYVPAALTSSDYPALVPPGGQVATIAVPTVLVSYNWKPASPRYLKVARFVETLYARMDRLRSPGFDPKWKEVDLTATAPGLARFKPAQDWLDRKVAERKGAPQ